MFYPVPPSRQNGRISSLEEKLRDVVMEMATLKSNYLVGVVKIYGYSIIIIILFLQHRLNSSQNQSIPENMVSPFPLIRMKDFLPAFALRLWKFSIKSWKRWVCVRIANNYRSWAANSQGDQYTGSSAGNMRSCVLCMQAISDKESALRLWLDVVFGSKNDLQVSASSDGQLIR